MIHRNSTLNISRQAELLGFSRGMVYYTPKPISETDLALCMPLINCIWRIPLWVRVCCVISVSALDTSYIPMAEGFVYLTAVIDWATRKVLAHSDYAGSLPDAYGWAWCLA